MKYFLFLSCFTFLFLGSCTKDKQLTMIDQQLYDWSKSEEGFVWYKNTTALLPKSSGSGHAQPFIRTRYNAIAAQQLDSTGKVKENAQFSDGSLIVKELTDAKSTIQRYAILYKDSKNPIADNKGWIWGYINSDVSVQVSALDRGAQCIQCHSQSGQIDYQLMNKFYP